MSLREAVFKEVAGTSGVPLGKGSHPAVNRMLRPFEELGYPLANVGDKSRVQKQANWTPDEKGARLLLEKSDEVILAARRARLDARKNGADEFAYLQELKRHVADALEFRAVRAYQEEWESQTPERIKEVVSAAVGFPKQANDLNAEKVAFEIRRRLPTRGIVSVFDAGTGGGGTILPIATKLSEKERKQVVFHLMDVMPNGLEHTKNRLLEMGVPEQNIRTIQANFYDLGFVGTVKQRPPGYGGNIGALEALRGKIDVFTGGASIHHLRDTTPFFQGAYNLLAPKGVLHFWDWGHYARTGREIELDSKQMQQRIPVTAGKSPTRRDTVHAMEGTWLNLFKAGDKAKRRLKQTLEKGGNFNFIQFLIEHRNGLAPTSQIRQLRQKGAVPLCMEGHEPLPERRQAVENAGFRVLEAHMPLYDEQHPRENGSLLYFIKAQK